jgi:hypothetical protein
MRWSVAARCGILISALPAFGHPAMGQTPRQGGHPAAGGRPTAMHPGNGGMQMHPHVQQQMQQQAQRQTQMHQQQMRQQYENDAKEFNQWLKANGGGTNKLPNNPQQFEAWAAKQKKAKAQGKSYDPMYDHYVNFAKSNGWMKSEGGQSQSDLSQSPAQGKGKNGQQPGAEGSMANNSATKKDGANRNAKPLAAEEKRAEARSEERRNAEKDREAARKRAMVADGTSISMLKTALGKLQQSDADYNGQREHAMQSVSQALHHLGVSAPATTGSIGGNTAQTQSDGTLREALKQLRSVETRLGGPAFNAPQHAEARASVSQAIHHLEAALKIQ